MRVNVCVCVSACKQHTQTSLDVYYFSVLPSVYLPTHLLTTVLKLALDRVSSFLRQYQRNVKLLRPGYVRASQCTVSRYSRRTCLPLSQTQWTRFNTFSMLSHRNNIVLVGLSSPGGRQRVNGPESAV